MRHGRTGRAGRPTASSRRETREQIVAVADELFYTRSFERTSLGAIAKAAGVSAGTTYLHFPSKDDILAAVIEARQASMREKIARWEAQEDTPLDRVACFTRIVLANSGRISRFDCRSASLIAELAKIDHPLCEQARGVLGTLRGWLSEQFSACGHDDEQAQEFAAHLVAPVLGVAKMYHAFGDDDFVERETAKMARWLDSLSLDPVGAGV